MRGMESGSSMTPMWELVSQTLYLFLPAYAANMAPVVAKRMQVLPSLARPLDGGRMIGGQPLFGAHKTLRGLIVGLLSAVVVAFLQRAGAERSAVFSDLASEPHTLYSPVLWGSALGGGALLGDLVKSFIKRRFGIPPGQRWFPWDQVDLIFGALLVGRLLYAFPWTMVATAILLTPLLGLIVNLGSYLLSIKEAW